MPAMDVNDHTGQLALCGVQAAAIAGKPAPTILWCCFANVRCQVYLDPIPTQGMNMNLRQPADAT